MSWQHHFNNVMADGDLIFNGEDYEEAINLFDEAYQLIPEPRIDRYETTRALTAIGDCFVQLRQFDKAEQVFRDVLLCPDAAANPFVRLRRGQVYQNLGNREQARTELTCAYMNGGLEVFEGEERYLELIKDVVDELDDEGFTPASEEKTN